jgi:peroxiredoxin
VISKASEKSIATQKIQTIPEFTYSTLNDLPFGKQDLLKNKATLFIYFNSECDFCQHEAIDISNNINKLKDIQILFISEESTSVIKAFAEQHQLNNLKNITFLHDSTSDFSHRFDTSTIPTILIYDTQQLLIKKHKGQLNVNGILKVIGK